MEILLPYLPAICCFALLGLLHLRFKRDENYWDIPFRDDHERPPGESLRLKIDDLFTDLSSDFMTIMVAIILPAVILPMNPNPYLYWAILIGSLSSVGFSGRNIWKAIPEMRSYNIGFKGERVTAQYLQPLLCQGHFVLHDIPMQDYNVDHVVVGPKGVFAIETKTRRKRRSAGIDRAKVVYDGNSLQYPEQKPENYGLEAAVSRARGLQQWLSSACGEKIPVFPILALPGWYVERTGRHGLPVMNPKSIPNFIAKFGNNPLTDRQIKQIRHQLFEKSKVEAKR